MASLAGQDITDLVFAGQDGLSADVQQVPLPAGIWLLLSGIGFVMGVVRISDATYAPKNVSLTIHNRSDCEPNR